MPNVEPRQSGRHSNSCAFIVRLVHDFILPFNQKTKMYAKGFIPVKLFRTDFRGMPACAGVHAERYVLKLSRPPVQCGFAS